MNGPSYPLWKMASDPPNDMAARKAASQATSRLREEMTARAGGMLDRESVATMLGVSRAEVDELRRHRQILGVLDGIEMRYPAAQFANGQPLHDLNRMLQALGDTNPWEQLMLLTTPLVGYGERPETVLQLLAKRPDADGLRQLVALLSGWAA